MREADHSRPSSIEVKNEWRITGEWRRLHNEEPYDLLSPNIIRVINSRKTRRAGHVARMGREEVHTDIGGETRGKD